MIGDPNFSWVVGFKEFAHPAVEIFSADATDGFFVSFGWVITNGVGLASYPIDTVHRRMMMTSGEAVKNKSSFNAFSQILKNEGPKSLFKGAGANILHAGPIVLGCQSDLNFTFFVFYSYAIIICFLSNYYQFQI
ncbi:hypothetical protein F2P56_021475 [Juglans regia]|uniref:ADP/ATP translocase n=2 Tax=Juglans regia TaxID=51240 RepID=A0A2I4GZD0_JUGRE|nr:ADP,ATP carrier protein, mitochondrial-like [Juglans regia]XP_035550849.1 ADP,ATP carrier protein, mitochondrial-like [Juglans regia]XP_035550850.1 ADP,ATP carrier protein, mitochondrial-like [Juglans regia]KAF5457370.1 hypothetical protein F2P56_021475 [Juglans regia]